MTSNAIFYFIEHVNDYTIHQYKYLQQSNLDIYVFIYKTNKKINRYNFPNNKNIYEYTFNDYKYNIDEISQFKLNKLKLIKSFYLEHKDNLSKYQHIYLIEPTFKYSQKLVDLFNILNNDHNDILSTYIQQLKNTSVKWVWYDIFKKYYNINNYNNILKSYDGGFLRLSTRFIEFISNDNDTIIDYFNDLAIPTLAYNNGFSIKSLSSSNEDDNEFYLHNYCNNKSFYFNTEHKNESDLDKSTPIIYNCYKKYNEVLDKIIHKIDNPDITVIMPIFNEAKTIERAIKSVINQENFSNYELWCINDGSTDGTDDILEEYKSHPNIVVINREHLGIVNTLNFGVENATGKYIMRMDADDIMLPNRMEVQFRYMEEHPEADILGSSVYLGSNSTPYYLGNYEVTLNSLLGGNRIFHPTAIMRSSSIRKLPYLYEYYYDCAEDYKLWVTCLLHGLRIFSSNDVVLRYSQPKTAANPKQAITAKRIQQLIRQIINKPTYDNEHEMTAIISFRDEYEEIEKTVASIRATTNNMPIILLNDASDNDYDYEFVAKKFHCKYIHNTTSVGCAGGRNQAVKEVETKYFIILDGHMRMYENDWDLRAIKIIKEYGENNVYFGRTTIITKTSKHVLQNENNTSIIHTYGACLKGHEFIMTPGWIHVPSEKNFNNEDNIIPVPLLLGADYMMSVEFWNKIHGLEGLLSWGQDETLLSLKVWLSGGKVLLIKDMIFGHIYRQQRPYKANSVEMNSNYIYTNYLFSRNEQEYNDLNYMYEKHLGHVWYMKAYDCFMERYDEAKAFKEYFFNEVVPKGCTQTMDWFHQFNYDADPKQVQEYYDIRDKILAERDANNSSQQVN